MFSLQNKLWHKEVEINRIRWCRVFDDASVLFFEEYDRILYKIGSDGKVIFKKQIGIEPVLGRFLFTVKYCILVGENDNCECEVFVCDNETGKHWSKIVSIDSAIEKEDYPDCLNVSISIKNGGAISISYDEESVSYDLLGKKIVT
jgi:hypothetical protein